MTLYQYPGYLMHYGIKGMRWGVVHEYEAVGRSNSKTKLTKEQKDEQLYATKISGQKKTKKQLKLEAKYKNKGMSSKEAEIKAYKTARNIRRAKIAGVAIVSAYAGYKVGSFVKDSGQLTALKNRNIDFNIDKSLASKNMSSDEIMNKIVSHINPGYGEKGTTMNCKRCTYAYEMSRRGYNVKATKSVKMTGQNLAGDYNVRHNTGGKNKLGITMTGAFKDAFTSSLKGENYVEKIQKNRIQVSVNEVNNVLSNKMPSGSRGEIIVKWKSGAQHSMAWEHLGDKAFIFDCKTNTKYSMDDFMKQLAPNITGTDLVRLDNVDFDMKYIKRWVQNA